MADLTIRKATADDATAIAKLSGQLGYPAKPAVMTERLGRVLQRDDHVVFVAEISEVVGWTHAGEHEILEVGPLCEIWGLVVADGQRGKSIGRRLVEAVEDWARRRGLTEVSVRSNVIRPESHPFYERIGFARYKTQHAYRKRLALPDS
jgi:GNAT superfamily N-acetyltransferase